MDVTIPRFVKPESFGFLIHIGRKKELFFVSDQVLLVYKTQRPLHVVCVSHKLLIEKLQVGLRLVLRFSLWDCVCPERVIFPNSQRARYKEH